MSGRVCVALVAGLIICGPAAAQSQLLFSEDFESGFGAWTVVPVVNKASLDWHIAAPGECGVAVTHMAAIGTACGYGKPTAAYEKLLSPTFLVPHGGYVQISFEAFWDMDLADAPENDIQIGLQDPGHNYSLM